MHAEPNDLLFQLTYQDLVSKRGFTGVHVVYIQREKRFMEIFRIPYCQITA